MPDITLQQAWDLFPDAMVEFDRSWAHLRVRKFVYWDLSATYGHTIYFVIDSCQDPRTSYCVDWNPQKRVWIPASLVLRDCLHDPTHPLTREYLL